MGSKVSISKRLRIAVLTVSDIQKKRRLLPIIDALEALHCFPSPSLPQKHPRVLTHAFSNGGFAHAELRTK